MTHHRSLLIACLLVASCLCVPTNAAPAEAISEAQAIAIAREAVAANDKWLEGVTFEAKRAGSGWVVIAWREPRTPHGDRFIMIYASGKIRSYVRSK
jgi:hypothetical protein